MMGTNFPEVLNSFHGLLLKLSRVTGNYNSDRAKWPNASIWRHIDSRVTMKASFMWMLKAKEYREMMRRR